MAEPTELLPQIITGILTGGAGAATSLLGVFKKTKERIADLEEALGKEEPVRTGLFLTIWAIDDTVKKIKREMDSWEEDNPPKWAERLVNKFARNSSHDLGAQADFEQTIQRSLRTFNERLSRAEDDLDAKMRRVEEDVKRDLAQVPTGKSISRDEYLADSRSRSAEILKLHEQLATVNGLLRGVMAALGIVDPKSMSRGSSGSDPEEAPRGPLKLPPKPPPRTGR
jgi:hypothetical protein